MGENEEPRSLNPRFKLDILPLKKGAKNPEIEKIQQFLTRFGYLKTSMSLGRLDNATSKALKIYQKSLGLIETGDLTQETIHSLECPRCGNPDIGMIAN